MARSRRPNTSALHVRDGSQTVLAVKQAAGGRSKPLEDSRYVVRLRSPSVEARS